MKNIVEILRRHSFPYHVVVFLAMILPSAGLYLAVNWGGDAMVWILLGIVALANFLAMVA